CFIYIPSLTMTSLLCPYSTLFRSQARSLHSGGSSVQNRSARQMLISNLPAADRLTGANSMNKQIAAELKRELEFIEAGIEVSKHAYAMQKLLGLLADSDDKQPDPEPQLEDNMTIRRTPVAKRAVDEDDDGNGRDIFDF